MQQESFSAQPIKTTDEYIVLVKQLRWLAEQYEHASKQSGQAIEYDLLPRWLDIVNTIGYLGALDEPLRNALKQHIDEQELIRLQQLSYKVEHEAEQELQRAEEYWSSHDPEAIARTYYRWFMQRAIKRSVGTETDMFKKIWDMIKSL